MAVDMFLKLDGIDGESVDKGYEKWIECLSFSWGISDGSKATNAPGKKPSARRAQVSDLSITKYLDAASPKLFEQVCEGRREADRVLQDQAPGRPDLERAERGRRRGHRDRTRHLQLRVVAHQRRRREGFVLVCVLLRGGVVRRTALILATPLPC